MKPQYYIPFILVALAVVFFIGKGCKQADTEHSKPVNVDSIVKSARDQERELVMLEKINERNDSIQKVYVIKWKEYKQKHDTIEVIRECIANCDSALNSQMCLIESLKVTNSEKDTLLDTWRNVHLGDSTNYAAQSDTIKTLRKEVKFQRRWKNFWKGYSFIATAANAVPR